MDLCDSIAQRRMISFTYDGHPRVVQPAAYGTHITTGNLLLRGYQVDGSSHSRKPPLWDLFSVEKMVGLQILEETFQDDPPGYSPGDKHLNVICEL